MPTQRAERNTKATRAWNEAPPNKAGPYVECHDAVVERIENFCACSGYLDEESRCELERGWLAYGLDERE